MPFSKGNGSSAIGSTLLTAIKQLRQADLPGDPALIDLPALCRRLRVKAASDLGDAITRFVVSPNESANGSQFGGVSIYVNPSEAERRRSRVAPRVDSDMYRRLMISKTTEWPKVALRGFKPIVFRTIGQTTAAKSSPCCSTAFSDRAPSNRPKEIFSTWHVLRRHA